MVIILFLLGLVLDIVVYIRINQKYGPEVSLAVVAVLFFLTIIIFLLAWIKEILHEISERAG